MGSGPDDRQRGRRNFPLLLTDRGSYAGSHLDRHVYYVAHKRVELRGVLFEPTGGLDLRMKGRLARAAGRRVVLHRRHRRATIGGKLFAGRTTTAFVDRKSTRLNSSHI